MGSGEGDAPARRVRWSDIRRELTPEQRARVDAIKAEMEKANAEDDPTIKDEPPAEPD